MGRLNKNQRPYRNYCDFRSLSKTHTTQISQAKRKILKDYQDVLGLILIGSVAGGDYQKNSDIDIVCIKSRKTAWRKTFKLTEKLSDKIQLVEFSKKQVLEHFKYSTTMAHSIRNGIILYHKDGFMDRLSKIRLSNPSKVWMRNWFKHWLRFYQMARWERRRNKRLHKKFCKGRCYCQVSDYLTRATVNFAILYLETQGIVPTTKRKITEGLEGIKNRKFRAGLKISIVAHRQNRYLSKREANTVSYTANWLKTRLQMALRYYKGIKK